jgi:hypothetical protein
MKKVKRMIVFAAAFLLGLSITGCALWEIYRAIDSMH